MKTKHILTSMAISAAVAAFTTSCGDKQVGDAELLARVDSLQNALVQSQNDYNQLDEYLTVIASSLDSIAQQESDIFNPSTESPAPNREQIKQQLTDFRQTLEVQRNRIAQLEEKLSSSNRNAGKLQAIILSLKGQIMEKESQIERLQAEIDEKNFTIEELKSRMSARMEQIDRQTKTIQAQKNLMNEGYVFIGSKQELKDAGLLEGGFLKKTKVDVDNIDKTIFEKIDIRQITDIAINSKNPKILTSVPEDAYTLEKQGSKTILHISDPDRFWNVSKYLIIQAK